MKIFRNLYNWVLTWAESVYSQYALFILAFAEASFFPIPPDILLIALCMGKPVKCFFYATICTIGSVLGGMFGYLIGYGVWQVVKGFFFTYVFSENLFNKVQILYKENAFWSIFTAGFTPIPYKIFTIAAGVCEVSFLTLVSASILSRGARFFLVSTTIWKFGPSVKTVIDKYFNLLTILFTILLIGGFLILGKLIK